MNSHQRMLKTRLQRKFSRNDGVAFINKQGLSSAGVVKNVQFDEKSKQWTYYVRDTQSQEDIELPEDHLISVPELNKGKYGGFRRGGASEKDVIASSYR